MTDYEATRAAAIGLTIVGVIMWLCFWGAVITVAAHFIGKLW